MDLMTMARTFPDMTVSIRLRDLMEANNELVRQVRSEVEREHERQKRQYGDYLIKREEARKMLGEPNKSTIWRWEKAGYLTPVKIGVKVFYRWKEIDAIVKSNEVKK